MEKFGYKKEGGKILLPVAGMQILEGSRIDKILLDNSNIHKIEIHGKFDLIINGETTKYEDLVEEFEEFVHSVIIGAVINKAWKDQHGSLIIEINSNPVVRIFVDNEGFDWPIAKWTYDHIGGYLTS